MCLYPTLIRNRKYIENNKNRGNIPPVLDPRTLYAPRGCGICMECRKKKAREWQARLQEDIKKHTNGKFITLTLSNESYQKLNNEIPEIKIINKKNWRGEIITQKEIKLIGYLRDNQIATKAIHLFRERYRKQFGKSIRHWLVTELGHNGTENIHLHGIIWTNETRETILQKWEYGYIFPRTDKEWKSNYVNAKTVNYITKYIYKTDQIHQTYTNIVLTSPGIGSNWKSDKNEYIPNKTRETYRTNTGHKISLPIYMRNKIYTEEEKEKLWIEKLNKEERWILGQKISIKNNENEYYKALKTAQETNKELGYNSPKETWKREKYEQQRREMMQQNRLKTKNASPLPATKSTPKQ